MLARIAADLLVLVHFLFICFVILGGLLALRWKWVVLLHLPAITWGMLIEFCGWICPLTPWENHLRAAAGGQGYEGGFVEHYLLSAIYPEGLTRNIQIGLGFLVLVINLFVYAWLMFQRFRQPEAELST